MFRTSGGECESEHFVYCLPFILWSFSLSLSLSLGVHWPLNIQLKIRPKLEYLKQTVLLTFKFTFMSIRRLIKAYTCMLHFLFCKLRTDLSCKLPTYFVHHLRCCQSFDIFNSRIIMIQYCIIVWCEIKRIRHFSKTTTSLGFIAETVLQFLTTFWKKLNLDWDNKCLESFNRNAVKTLMVITMTTALFMFSLCLSSCF